MKTNVLAVLLLLLATPLLAEPALVLLPLENLSGVADATFALEPLLARKIEQRGWRVDAHRADALLEQHRVRYFDSLDPVVREAILRDGNAAAFVSATVYAWRDGEDAFVAISARMFGGDGTLLWAEVAALTASDTETLLGLGRSRSARGLAAHAVERLMSRLPRPGGGAAVLRGPSKPLWRAGVPVFRSAALARGTRHRLAILPFDTASRDRMAPRVIADILAIRLAASDDFEVVEPAFLRAGARKTGIRSFAFIESSELTSLSEALGTPLFLRGSIYSWSDALRRGAPNPEVQLEISLVDVTSGRVLWSSIASRRGDEYEGLLLLGRVSNAVTLADRVLSEMIQAGAHAPLRGNAIARANERPGKSQPVLQAKGISK